MLEELKRRVYEAHRMLVEHGLVTLTFGNVSAMDRESGVLVIKPSGVNYREMTWEDMVLVDPHGVILEGRLKPSSDTSTHRHLYGAFSKIGGVCHTHSPYATMFSQARTEIECYGTTHADHFAGRIPMTRPLSQGEVAADYEGHTGRVIVERFQEIRYQEMPAVLTAGHAPFTWGPTPERAVENAIALEFVAKMAFGTRLIRPEAPMLEPHVLDKHYQRKHGPEAYYGQG